MGQRIEGVYFNDEQLKDNKLKTLHNTVEEVHAKISKMLFWASKNLTMEQQDELQEIAYPEVRQEI